MTSAVGSVPGTLISWAAGVIGIPASVVAAQINEESGGNATAESSTGAQGVAQFEPGTWSSEGCTGSPDNVNDAMKCYAKYMYSLVQQYHGNVRDALAAYNAGPDDLSAGYGYADAILANSGQAATLDAAGGTGSTSSSASAGSYGTDCAIKFPGLDLGITSVGSGCLVTYGTERAIISGLVLGAAGLLALVGFVILAASALGSTPAGRVAESVAPVSRVVSAVTPKRKAA
jgi:Transglycosylase SLT domain